MPGRVSSCRFFNLGPSDAPGIVSGIAVDGKLRYWSAALSSTRGAKRLPSESAGPLNIPAVICDILDRKDSSMTIDLELRGHTDEDDGNFPRPGGSIAAVVGHKDWLRI